MESGSGETPSVSPPEPPVRVKPAPDPPAPPAQHSTALHTRERPLLVFIYVQRRGRPGFRGSWEAREEGGGSPVGPWGSLRGPLEWGVCVCDRLEHIPARVHRHPWGVPGAGVVPVAP